MWHHRVGWQRRPQCVDHARHRLAPQFPLHATRHQGACLAYWRRRERRLGPGCQPRRRLQVRAAALWSNAAAARDSHSILLSVRLSMSSYRLCPRSSSAPLTEECFQRHPLAFVGNTTDIVGATGEVLHTIPATRTTRGTTPPGSEWTRNPVPDQHDPGVPPNFRPPVPGLAGHCCDEGCPDGCGDGFGQIWNIMDRVRVPSGLSPGDYVLSWRWDAEELPQGEHVYFACSLYLSLFLPPALPTTAH